MLLIETAIFYLLFGIVVAAAIYLRGGLQEARAREERDGERPPGRIAGESRLRVGEALQLAAACLFWPFYLPILLATNEEVGETNGGPHAEAVGAAPEHDALAAAIEQVEAELDAALEGLDGWAEDVLNCEARRLSELRAAWRLQAERIRQLDRLLAAPTTTDDPLTIAAADVGKARQSEKVRQENIQQLAAFRKQLHADLIGTLAWVRELVTMIHLAKFSGAPAARAEALVVQIAAAVQGLSEVSAWREEGELAAANAVA